MSKRKIIIPIEDQITDYFDSAPQHAVETLLRVITRQVIRRFPPAVVEAKGNGKTNKGGTKVVKPVKPALGAGLKQPPVKPTDMLNDTGNTDPSQFSERKDLTNAESQS